MWMMGGIVLETESILESGGKNVVISALDAVSLVPAILLP